ncbi:response regulator [Novispirillum sp. DQ9]|uniref:response regulator n=1 Tax=Novispirillum sp. DQ9 TaxID=3398612 RepID=UPI003C7E3ED8
MTTDLPQFNILLVEDDEGDAHLTRLALREGRLLAQVHHVYDGVEALAFLRGTHAKHADAPRPDLILLDLNMPRMDGREFLTEVKRDEDLRSIPVVVLTTSDVERDIDASYRRGASGYITKPVGMDQFIDAVRALDDYWFSVVRLPGKASA